MQASESKGTLDCACWEAAQVRSVRCGTAWDAGFSSCRIPRGVWPCAFAKKEKKKGVHVDSREKVGAF